jgi:response regulator NasT
MPEVLRIVVIVSDPDLSQGDEQALAQAERSRLLRIGLLEAGYNLVATLPADPFLTERLAQLQADLVIVDAESDARDALEHVVIATRDERRPIVLFTSDDDTSHVPQAVAAGVTAYIVHGLAPERISPILTVAMARFRHQEALLAELENARGELQERKVVDRAKGLLMQRQGLSEPQAYAKLRKAAMNKGVKLVDIAQQMIDLAELFS